MQVQLSQIKTPKMLTILSMLLALNACSESRPDGYVYQVNAAGMTLPAAGAEVAFLPGTSRADFFYGPLSEAYAYATADLGTELILVCEEANTVLVELQDQNKEALNQLKAGGNLPETPEACFNMCTQRVGLEEQRSQDREQLGQTIARLNSQISLARENIKALEASRSDKAGELGRRLASLESARLSQLSQSAQELVDEQISSIGFRLGGQVKSPTLYRGEQIRVTLVNGSDYALLKADYNLNPILVGYYKGEEIVRSSVRIPRYDQRTTNRDEFGFDRGYLVEPGGSVVIGVSINDFPGLSVNSPQGRLMAREKGWTANSKGYILPDEVRIQEFPRGLFVIPDKKGTRTGSTITYNPIKVNFRAEAAAKGLPQDAEIARLKRQIDNQSYPEDSQIEEQNAEIASLESAKRKATDDFNNSTIASKISQLSASEDSCRVARELSSNGDKERQELAAIEADLSSCGPKDLNPMEVLAGVARLNNTFEANIETPDVSSRYRAKAKELVMTKVADSLSDIALTGIGGDYRVADGMETGLVLVDWRSSFSESFWFQPLASLGDSKDLTYATAEDGSFEDLAEQVIWYGAGASSVEQLSTRMLIAGDHERSPFSAKQKFTGLAEAAKEDLMILESNAAEESAEVSSIANVVPLACEP